MSNLSKEGFYRNQAESLVIPESTLQPGSLIFWICDSTDDNPHGGLINGVKRTQLEVTSELRRMGYHVLVVYPKMVDLDEDRAFFYLLKDFAGYDGFDLSINPTRVWELIKRFKPDGVVVSTIEGPLGQAVAMAHNFPSLVGLDSRDDLPYIASFTTRVDMFIAQTINHQWRKLLAGVEIPGAIPELISSESFEPILNLLYNDAQRVLVPTQSMLKELERTGMRDIAKRGVLWPRGVDDRQWHLPELNEANPYQEFDWFKKHPNWPIFLYYGRVAVEKNIDSLLASGIQGAHIVVIGDGPYLVELTEKYPDAHFLGKMHADKLSQHVRFANIHVFTSLTDTFGNTLLEAGASGVPSVGFKGVPGPQDVIIDGINGFLIEKNEELMPALQKAMAIDRLGCSKNILDRFSWKSAAKMLLAQLPPTAFFSLREEGHLDKQFR